ncbi:hypothetical protein [Vibrio cholerae]|uniref:hypothetical protein n=1 Tax=Vibrio cholerae TaxID=666 RepID=UPI000E0C7428|nr:hypothetical protein [Vibrio cholerae]EMA3788830.1 hypothetical protein [Vibrio cholerae]TVN03436.1 hypothetical protein FPV63_12500 [Vibrio cholerae]TVN17357.1 hypothetical protein FPW20_11005 [Vibrio cholerae]
MISTSLEELSQHLQERIQNDYEAYEKFVESVPLSLIRELYDFQSNERLTTNLPLAIMTFIAIGDSLSRNLEKKFPELKGASPLKGEMHKIEESALRKIQTKDK